MSIESIEYVPESYIVYITITCCYFIEFFKQIFFKKYADVFARVKQILIIFFCSKVALMKLGPRICLLVVKILLNIYVLPMFICYACSSVIDKRYHVVVLID